MLINKRFVVPRTDAVTERLQWENRLNGLLNVRGALVARTSNQTITHDTDTAVSFSVADYIGVPVAWNISNPTRLVVSGGLGRARVYGCINFAAAAALSRGEVFFKKNGALFFGNARQEGNLLTGHDTHFSCASGIIGVQDGDYFEMFVHQHSGSPLDLVATSDGSDVWACLEVIG